MSEVMSTILTSFNSPTLWSTVTKVLPILFPILLFAFGFALIKHYINNLKFTLKTGLPPIGWLESRKLRKKYHMTVYRNGKLIKRY